MDKMMSSVPASSSPDPVFEQPDGWYYWDEDWIYKNGPFPDQGAARAAAISYGEALNRPRPDQPQPEQAPAGVI